MELRGELRTDRALLVVALAEEADALDDELPILVTGPGKVHAAVAVTAALAVARPTAAGQVELEVRCGAVGAVSPPLAGEAPTSR